MAFTMMHSILLHTHIKNRKLAVPAYKVPGRIELLIGANTFGLIVLDDLINGSVAAPTARFTC